MPADAERKALVSRSDTSSAGDQYQIDAVARALKLLMVIAQIGRPVRLAELVEKLGWTKPSVYRLLRTLEVGGALVRVGTNGYVPGPAMITIGHAALERIELAAIAAPYLEALYDDVGETTRLAILDEHEVVYIGGKESVHILAERIDIGSRLPAYCTALGHVLLAALPDESVRQRLGERELVVRAPNTITSVDKLLVRLQQVRAQGYGISDEELVVGLRSAAAPIQDHTGAVVAAMSVGVPAARVSRDHLETEVVPRVITTARAISRHLGDAETV